MPVYLVLDRVDERTLEWFHGQRRALAIAAGETPPASPAESLAFLRTCPEAVASAPADGDPVPLLHRWLGSESEALERTLVELDAISAVGLRVDA